MADFGTLYLNGKEIPMAAPPKVSFVGERTIGTGLFLRGQEIHVTELTFRADRRAFVCFQLALSGGRPHRSHRCQAAQGADRVQPDAQHEAPTRLTPTPLAGGAVRQGNPAGVRDEATGRDRTPEQWGAGCGGGALMGTFMQELERIQIRTATAMAIEAEHKAERARLEVEKARVELRTAQRIDEQVKRRNAS